MRIKPIIFCVLVSVSLCFGIAQLGSANDVASSEFSSLVAANSYANSGDMNANISIEDQYVEYENSGEKLEFAGSFLCSISCSTSCSINCSGVPKYCGDHIFQKCSEDSCSNNSEKDSCLNRSEKVSISKKSKNTKLSNKGNKNTRSNRDKK